MVIELGRNPIPFSRGTPLSYLDALADGLRAELESLSLYSEIWADVEDYIGRYQVSNMGRVRALPRVIVGKRGCPCLICGGIKPQQINHAGYMNVTLSIAKRNKCHFLVHRLVGIAFIPNPDNKRSINHKNGVKTDNYVENLEWATHSENMLHAYENGLQNCDDNKKKAISAKNSKAVLCLQNGKIYSNQMAAGADLGMTSAGVSMSIKYKKPVSGYQFEFVSQESYKPSVPKNEKPVKCLENGKIYPSMLVAANELGLGTSSVSASVRLGVPRKGYTFVRV